MSIHNSDDYGTLCDNNQAPRLSNNDQALAMSSGDWEKRTDPSSGRDFYINHKTREVRAPEFLLTPTCPPGHARVANPMLLGISCGQTSWTPPMTNLALPPGWEEKRDAQVNQRTSIYTN